METMTMFFIESCSIGFGDPMEQCPTGIFPLTFRETRSVESGDSTEQSRIHGTRVTVIIKA